MIMLYEDAVCAAHQCLLIKNISAPLFPLFLLTLWWREMAVNYEQDEYSSGMSAKHNSMGFVKNGQYSDGLEI